MLAILLHSIHKPDILAHATLLKKQIIVKLILLLSLILSIPTMVHTHHLIQNTRQDLSTIVAHLPAFRTATPRAIQTSKAYFLYDLSNSVSHTTLEKTIPQYTISIIVQNEVAQVSVFGSQVLTHPIQSPKQVEDLLHSLMATLPFTQLLTPLFIMLFNLFSLMIQNYILTLACHLFFMLRQKLVQFKHLWRVSLFASFGPYVILSVLNLFKLNVSFELFFVLLYTIYVQTAVMKTITNKE